MCLQGASEHGRRGQAKSGPRHVTPKSSANQFHDDSHLEITAINLQKVEMATLGAILKL